MYDTLIIGAGMSGLAAGIRLAHFGQRVCILERHSAIGGLNSFYRQRGRTIDVGLHAVTNYSPKGARTGPLARAAAPVAPGLGRMGLGAATRLGDRVPRRHAAVLERLRAARIGGAAAFSPADRQFPPPGGPICTTTIISANRRASRSAREVVAGIIDDPLLVEMIFCPILFYGSARSTTSPFDQFSILFRSIFLEGLARPLAGSPTAAADARAAVQGARRRVAAAGGRRAQIVVRDGAVEKVVLADGSELEARNVLSSAGWAETMRMCDDAARERAAQPTGCRSSSRSRSSTAQPQALGHEKTIVFYNDSETVPLREAGRPGRLCGAERSVRRTISPIPSRCREGMIRISALANYERWAALEPEAYRVAKLRWYDRLAAAAVRFVPDFRGRSSKPTCSRRGRFGVSRATRAAPSTARPGSGPTAPPT